MTIQHRSAFFVSDRTAITAEMLGHSLLTQFDDLNLHENTLPFIDSLEKAQEAVQQINAAAVADGVRPIIISTLANTEIAAAVGRANALFLDGSISSLYSTELKRSDGWRAMGPIVGVVEKKK